MSILERNNADRAAGFARLIRIATILFALCLVGKCAFGQTKFTSPFQVRVHGDTTLASHALVDVSLDSAALMIVERSGLKRLFFVACTGVEIREAGTLYVLTDGVSHHVKDKSGSLVAWSGSMGKWLLYEYIPMGVELITKRD